MDIFVNLLVYAAFAGFASLLAKLSYEHIQETQESSNRWDIFLIGFVAFLTIIAAFRSNVGYDHVGYARIFALGRANFSGKEPLWNNYVYWAYRHNIHWIVSMGLCAFLQIYFITKSTMKYRWVLVFLPIVLFGGRYWLDMMNAVRQMIVACVFLWATKYIQNKNFIFYLIFLFIASKIHQSAWLLLPFFFIPSNLSIQKHRWILIGILLLCVIVGQSPNFTRFGEQVRFIIQATNYDEYEEGLVLYLNGQGDEKLSFGLSMLSYLLVAVLIVLYGPKMRKRYGKSILLYDLWYNFAYFYACMYFLVCNLGHYYIRPVQYFELFQMVMATLVLFTAYTDYKHEILSWIRYYLICAIMILNTAWGVIKDTKVPIETTTYKMLFVSEKNKDLLDNIL